MLGYSESVTVGEVCTGLCPATVCGILRQHAVMLRCVPISPLQHRILQEYERNCARRPMTQSLSTGPAMTSSASSPTSCSMPSSPARPTSLVSEQDRTRDRTLAHLIHTDFLM